MHVNARPGDGGDCSHSERRGKPIREHQPELQPLVLGIGNTLLSDDGIGVHVIQALEARELGCAAHLRDGGTLGLSLLPEIEDCEALIAVDATEMGAAPGTVRTFEDAKMDVQLLGRKRTVHELALAELMQAARLMGKLPARRALVAIQPSSAEWGLSPTRDVLAAIPRACSLVISLLEAWSHGR
jgi:hydrogenase maturation protease